MAAYKRFESVRDTAQSDRTFKEARDDREFWERLTKSAVGAHLVNAAAEGSYHLFYWREDNQEVDFILRAGRKVTAIAVKSGRTPTAPPGMAAFSNAFKPMKKLLVGGDGITVEEFFQIDAAVNSATLLM